MMLRILIAVSFGLLILPPQLCQAGDDSVDGYYSKLVPYCHSSAEPPNFIKCYDPVEESVDIIPDNNSMYYLHIRTEGSNMHFCEYEGIARMVNGKLISFGENCKVFVEVVDGVASIGSEGAGCNAYCGARAQLVTWGLKKVP